MDVKNYFSKHPAGLSVSASQASHFAKTVAGDFNPIHDEDARKFCVPGDLIFAIVLSRFYIHKHMEFGFLGTVGADVGLSLPELCQEDFDITNEKGKAVVNVQLRGGQVDNAQLAENLTKSYVAFSGRNFPHILVPMMAERDVMINPARPLVMYESMALDFDHLDFDSVQLEMAKSSLDVEGKRGRAHLNFELVTNSGESIGRGSKKLALGGLMPYSEQEMADVIARYEAKKAAYENEFSHTPS